MLNQPPLNPDAQALRKAVEAVHNETYGAHGDLAHIAVNAYVYALAVAQPGVTSVDYLATPRGHYDAWADTGDGYTQRKGWTLTCLWCRAEFTGDTKREALQGYRGHEESILQKLREADATERAKNRPAVNDAT